MLANSRALRTGIQAADILEPKEDGFIFVGVGFGESGIRSFPRFGISLQRSDPALRGATTAPIEDLAQTVANRVIRYLGIAVQ